MFCKLVALCQAKGLVKEECRVMTDATLITADASTESMEPKESEQTQQEKETPPRSGGPLGTPAKPKVSNHTHHNCTDPDATLARKDRTPLQLKYKVHQTIDAESRVILDTHVTTGTDTTASPIWSNSNASVSVMRFTFARQLPIGVTARRRSFGIYNSRESRPIFPCGAAGWEMAST